MPATKAKRGPKGTGTVRFRADKDRWEARVSWYDSLGKRHYKSQFYRTRKEALLNRTTLVAKYAAGSLDRSDDVSFASYVETWLQEKQRSWTPASYRTQSSYVHNHILGPRSRLGKMPLRSITLEDVDRFMADIEKAQVGAPTREGVFVAMNAIFAYAIKKGRVASNPCANATRPTVVKVERDILTIAQSRALLTVADKNVEYGSLIRFLLDVGCRSGEAFGLSWDDVHLDEGFVWIRSSLSKDLKNEHILKPTKTEIVRQVFLEPETVAAMRRLPRDREAKWNLVWTTVGGLPLDKDRFRKSVAYPMFKEAKLPKDFVVHGLRHTAASLQLQNGVDLATVMARGGWANEKTLMRIYAHSSTEAQKAGVAKMADLKTSADTVVVTFMGKPVLDSSTGKPARVPKHIQTE